MKNLELFNVLAPLIDDPNAIVHLIESLSIYDPHLMAICSDYFYKIRHLKIVHEMTIYTDTSPMHLATGFGYTEFVKLLAPLTENPNAPDKCGMTPIHYATYYGHTEIVKILVRKS